MPLVMSERQSPKSELQPDELDRERFHISQDFLARYNRPGPRYTSYPTAPVWRDDFGPDDLEGAYEQADAARTPISLYMHLPFCESLCLFCACNVVITKDHSVAPPYLATLKHEIEHVSALCFALASDRAISLGRRHAHLPDARADGRSLWLRRRAIFVRPRRRNRHRSRSARHQRRSTWRRCAAWASIG